MFIKILKEDDYELVKDYLEKEEVEFTEFDNPLRAACYEAVEDFMKAELDGIYSYEEVENIVSSKMSIIGDQIYESEKEILDMEHISETVCNFLEDNDIIQYD